jgi:N-acetylneuraminate synthase
LVDGIRFIEKMNASPVDKDSLAGELQPLRRLFGKSIVARQDLPAGTVLKEAHLALRKPGHGLPEKELSHVLNRKLRVALPANAFILEEHLE